MHALPFEPFVAFHFRLLPCVVHAHRNPGIFLQDRILDQQGVHDRKKTCSLEIIALQLGIIGKQRLDVRVHVGRPGLGRTLLAP